MLQAEFVKLAESGLIERVVLYTRPMVNGWEIWAYGYPDNRGNDPLSKWGNRLKTTRQGHAKTYTSLDRAMTAIREMGWIGQITIDGIPSAREESEGMGPQ